MDEAQTLADWVATTLKNRGIAALSGWRMLEYWAQAELYGALCRGEASGRSHFGHYEQPYFTRHPRGRSNHKWVDLLIASDELDLPTSFTWIEMKDLGRSKSTWNRNVWGLGADLAALHGFDLDETVSLWRTPSSATYDRGRIDKWKGQAAHLARARHRGAQLVLASRDILDAYGEQALLKRWGDAFTAKTSSTMPRVGRADADNVAIYAAVLDLAGSARRASRCPAAADANPLH